MSLIARLQNLTVQEAWDWSWAFGKKALRIWLIVGPPVTVAYFWAVAELDANAQEYIGGVIEEPLAAQAVQIQGLAKQVGELTAVIEELQTDAATPAEQVIGADKLERVACLLEAQARGEDPLLRCGQ